MVVENASLFAEDGLPLERVSLSKVAGKMAEFPEYTGQFIVDVIGLPSNSDYQYISDYNNTLKHSRDSGFRGIYFDANFDAKICKKDAF